MNDNKGFHPKNKHNNGYNFPELEERYPPLKKFVEKNKYDTLSIDFKKPKAVLALNKALLLKHYNLEDWFIPKGYLCPPIPSRADYIHHVFEQLNLTYLRARVLDVGTGANIVYPIIAISDYTCSVIATDIDPIAIDNAEQIKDRNPLLAAKLELRHQANPNHVFKGVVQKFDNIDLVICNPPFHSSLEEAKKGSMRKGKALNYKSNPLNFGGQKLELYCEGGELQFITNMIDESRAFSRQIKWFTSLVSKESNLNALVKIIKRSNTKDYKVIKMVHGQKKSRILCWRF